MADACEAFGAEWSAALAEPPGTPCAPSLSDALSAALSALALAGGGGSGPRATPLRTAAGRARVEALLATLGAPATHSAPGERVVELLSQHSFELFPALARVASHAPACVVARHPEGRAHRSRLTSRSCNAGAGHWARWRHGGR
jgi:hypothetical protein